MAGCLSTHPLTKGESYIRANANLSHEEYHRSRMIHYVSHPSYGAGGKKESWHDRRNLGN